MDGYTCPICQQYVLWGSLHSCPGYNPMPFNPAMPGIPPLAQPTPGCRAPWMPLTLEDIRKAVREEIERRFPEPVDEGLRQALARKARMSVCPKCGQDPYDGHDMCSPSPTPASQEKP